MKPAQDSNWPICLRLCVGTARLILPAALFEQTLACSPVEVAAAPRPGWHLLERNNDSAFSRLSFQGEESIDWRATWLAVFRRLPDNVTGQRRFALLMNDAPQVLAPLDDRVAVSSAELGDDALASVAIGDEALVVPDLTKLSILLPAGRVEE